MKIKQNNQRGLTTLSQSKGFTIIEVLIVLAIAGLIMLIVFLAVPALQRNSRNTQRRADVSRILGAISESVSNNNGVLPVSCAAGAAATQCNAGGTFLDNASLGLIPKNSVSHTNTALAPGSATTNATLDTVVTANWHKCNATGTLATTTGGSARSVVALYLTETGGTPTLQCLESGA